MKKFLISQSLQEVKRSLLFPQNYDANIISTIHYSQWCVDILFIVHMYLTSCGYNQVPEAEIPIDYSLREINNVRRSCNNVLQLDCFAAHRFGSEILAGQFVFDNISK